MKHFIILLGCLLVVQFSSFAQNKSKAAKAEAKLENAVKQYWFVLLLKGERRTQDSATAAKIQEGHMANINKLYYEGKLKVAGPFGDDGNWRGIFIFDCATREEVEKLLATDPAIAAGRLVYEIHPWYTAPVGSFKEGKPVASDQ
jgi:uncharacterized protein